MDRIKSAISALFLVPSAFSGETATAQTVATRPDAPVPASCTLSQQPVLVLASLRDLPLLAAEFRRQRLDMADVVSASYLSTSKTKPHEAYLIASSYGPMSSGTG